MPEPQNFPTLLSDSFVPAVPSASSALCDPVGLSGKPSLRKLCWSSPPYQVRSELCLPQQPPGLPSVAILLTLGSVLFATEHTRFAFLSVGIRDCAGFMPVVSKTAQGPVHNRSSATVSGKRRSPERGREADERAAGCLVHPSPTATSPPSSQD